MTTLSDAQRLLRQGQFAEAERACEAVLERFARRRRSAQRRGARGRARRQAGQGRRTARTRHANRTGQSRFLPLSGACAGSARKPAGCRRLDRGGPASQAGFLSFAAALCLAARAQRRDRAQQDPVRESPARCPVAGTLDQRRIDPDWFAAARRTRRADISRRATGDAVRRHRKTGAALWPQLDDARREMPARLPGRGGLGVRPTRGSSRASCTSPICPRARISTDRSCRAWNRSKRGRRISAKNCCDCCTPTRGANASLRARMLKGRICAARPGEPAWNGYYFYRHGARRDENCARCPATSAALDRLPLPQVREHAPEVLFSVFTAGTHLLPHRGVTNTRVVGHLPLLVPEDCALNVGGEIHVWQEGRVVVFDDTYEHEAWNRSQEMRVVLIFDLWNPGPHGRRARGRHGRGRGDRRSPRGDRAPVSGMKLTQPFFRLPVRFDAETAARRGRGAARRRLGQTSQRDRRQQRAAADQRGWRRE